MLGSTRFCAWLPACLPRPDHPPDPKGRICQGRRWASNCGGRLGASCVSPSAVSHSQAVVLCFRFRRTTSLWYCCVRVSSWGSSYLCRGSKASASPEGRLRRQGRTGRASSSHCKHCMNQVWKFPPRPPPCPFDWLSSSGFASSSCSS